MILILLGVTLVCAILCAMIYRFAKLPGDAVERRGDDDLPPGVC